MEDIEIDWSKCADVERIPGKYPVSLSWSAPGSWPRVSSTTPRMGIRPSRSPTRFMKACLSNVLAVSSHTLESSMSRILLDQNAPRQGFRIASPSYPTIALQELVRNAVIHRNYEATASPVMLTWYANRVEITSPGGLTARLPPKRSASPVSRMHAIQRLPAPRRRWASCNDLGRESPPRDGRASGER
jgi:hypothetical protein